jgi:hypothetical protein
MLLRTLIALALCAAMLTLGLVIAERLVAACRAPAKQPAQFQHIGEV